MALLSNPTLPQLQLIRDANIKRIFEASACVAGVGIGPQTSNKSVPDISLDANGSNTIVIVVDVLNWAKDSASLSFDTLSDMDGNQEISVRPSYVARGTYIASSVGSSGAKSGPAQSVDLDAEFFRPTDPNLPSVRLLVNDTKERHELMSGVHIEAHFKRTKVVKLPIGGCKPAAGNRKAPGTLGFIGQTNTGKLVAVTCHHVAITTGAVFTTGRTNNGEVSGAEITGDYVVSERGGDFVLQVKPEGTATLIDAPTRRTWRQQNGMRSDNFMIGHPTPGDCCELDTRRRSIGVELFRGTWSEQILFRTSEVQ